MARSSGLLATTFRHVLNGKLSLFQQLMKALELCLKAYGEGHMLYVRLCLNIGILYEDDRQFQEAYDYFIRWDKACMEVSYYCFS